MRKYRNEKTVVAGLTFDSKAEARRYGELQLLERAGRISDLRRQVPIELAPSVTRDRCRAALADAVANGLPELEIRRMAKLPEWQLQQPAQEAQPASLPAPRKRGR